MCKAFLIYPSHKYILGIFILSYNFSFDKSGLD